MRNRWDKQDTTNKVVDFDATVFIVTLNVHGLNREIKNRLSKLSTGKSTLNIKAYTVKDTPGKHYSKKSQSYCISINELDLRTENVTEDKEKNHKTIKGSTKKI